MVALRNQDLHSIFMLPQLSLENPLFSLDYRSIIAIGHLLAQGKTQDSTLTKNQQTLTTSPFDNTYE
jgi:Na+-transporting NADH:ubiquinone oxidoreductase subunit NqrA